MRFAATSPKMGVYDAKTYLQMVVQNKLNTLMQNREPQSKKIEDKIALLKDVLHAVKHHTEVSKEKLLEKHPLAFQSFWAEKGEVEQLFDACLVFQDKCNAHQQDGDIADCEAEYAPMNLRA